MKELKEFYTKHPDYLFFFISLEGVLGFIVLSLLYGNGFDWVTMGGSSQWNLTDFARHIYLASDLNRTYYYGNVASFPPLAYLFFALIYRINPSPIQNFSWLSYTYSPYIIIIYVMLLTNTVLAFVLAVNKITRTKLEKTLLLCASLLCSLPFFAGAIERGNPVFLTLVFILYGLYLRDSSDRKLRELALIFLAVAVNFKIYPAVVGLLYLKEKRFKEAFRFILYSLVMFFVPFIFTGGLEGLRTYFRDLTDLSGMTATEYMSFKHLTSSLLEFLGTGAKTADLAGKIAGPVCLVILLILAWITREKWKEYLFLSLIMSYYLPSNYRYNAVFLAIPLLFLMRECGSSPGSGASDTTSVNDPDKIKSAAIRTPAAAPDEKTALMRAVYMALFGVIMTVQSWIYPGRPEIPLSVAAMTIFALAGAEEFLRLRRKVRH